MSTAQAFYEIYKSLPKKTKREVFELITEESPKGLKAELIEGLLEIKAINSGKQQGVDFKDFLSDLKNGS